MAIGNAGELSLEYLLRTGSNRRGCGESLSVPDVAPDVILAVVVAVRWVPPICVAVIVQFPVEPGATYRPEVAPIVPQEADHATSSVVENCSDWLTMTVGFDGVIVNAEGVVPAMARSAGCCWPSL